MVFDAKLRLQVQTELIKQYDTLLYSSLEYLRENFSNYHKVAFENMMPKTPPYILDQESCIRFMLSSVDDISNTKFLFREPGHRGWGGNEIRFPFIKRIPPITEWGTPQFWNYREWRDHLEYACEDEFWKVEKVYQASKFSTLRFFDDKIFRPDELSKYENKIHFLYIKENWLQFVHGLIELFIPQFPYSEIYSTKKVRRHLKEIQEGVWFGFEYEISEIVHDLKTGRPSLPEQLNLILINPEFDKNADVKKYYFNETNGLICLGILGNPFFYQPCYMLSGFYAVDKHRNEIAGTPYLSRIAQIDSGEFQLLHPEVFAERMKKHAFFYVHLLAATSKPYLDYVQSVLYAVMSAA